MLYIIKNGKNLALGIFKDKESFEKELSISPNASHCEVNNMEDAIAFLNTTKNKVVSKNLDSNKSVTIYVDGSFKKDIPLFGYVILDEDENIIKEGHGKSNLDPAMRNISGEVTASAVAVKEAICLGYKEINLYYDYSGIEKWVTGEWQSKKEGTKKYASFMAKAKKMAKINFHKVKGHSNNKWNDYADKLAGSVQI